MGLGTRIFIVNDDDTLKRMPMKRYHRLFRQDPEERFSEYADNRIRYVLVVLELENRKPVEILRNQYSYLAFDPQGRLREDEREKAARLSTVSFWASRKTANPHKVRFARITRLYAAKPPIQRCNTDQGTMFIQAKLW